MLQAYSDKKKSRDYIYFISFFYVQLKEFYSSTKEYTSQTSFQRWIAKLQKRPHEYERLYLPINIKNNHWVLCVIFMVEKRILYYDPLFAQVKSSKDASEVYHYIVKWMISYFPAFNENQWSFVWYILLY